MTDETETAPAATEPEKTAAPAVCGNPIVINGVAGHCGLAAQHEGDCKAA
jgi:hypothetical protein